MKLNTNLKPNKVYSKILIYITFVVVATILILSTILYVNFENIALYLINSSIKDSLYQVSYSTKYMTDSAKSLALQIYFEPKISKLLYFNYLDISQQEDAFRKLRSLKSTTPFVHSIYLLNNRSEIIYMDIGKKFKKDLFFDQNIVHILNNFSDYKSLTPIPRKIEENVEQFDEIIPSNVYTYIFYEKPIASNSIDKAVILNITEEWMHKIIDSLDTNPNRDIFIVDNKGMLVSNNFKYSMLTDISQLDYIQKILSSNDSSGYFIENIDNIKSIVTYVSSPTTEWKFIEITPYNIITDKINNLKYNTMFIGILTLLCGIISSIFLSQKLYQPYKVMDTKMQSLEAERRKSFYTLKQIFLNNILQGKINSTYDILLEKFNRFQIKFDIYGNFVLVLFNIDYYNDFLNKYNSTDRKLFKFGIMNISSELCSTHFKNECIDTGENHIVLLINTNQSNNNHKTICNIIKNIQEAVKKHLDISLSFVITQETSSIDDISYLYEEAINTSNYLLFKERECIISTEDVSILQSGNFKYPIKKQTLLVNTLMLGKTKEAKKLYMDIINSTKNYSYNVFYSTLLRLALAVNTVIDNIKQNSNVDIAFNFNAFINEINKLETIKDIHNKFIEIFEYISRKIKETKNSKHDNLANNIVNIVNNNYTDKNLCINTIADKLNMSPVYLGRLFKQLTSKSIAELINEIRMKKAKELLETTNYPISKIVDDVGFSNSSYFYPLFKKMNGITPSEYRKNANKN